MTFASFPPERYSRPSHPHPPLLFSLGHSFYDADPMLKRVIDQIKNGHFSPDAPDRFHTLIDSILVHGDNYCLCKDYASYVEIQDKVPPTPPNMHLCMITC